MKAPRKSSDIIKVNPPAKKDLVIIRLLITLAASMMLFFIVWFIDPEHVGYAPIFWLLTFALIFKLVKMVHEWYHYWSPSVPVMPESTRTWTVDMLTTACPGEPKEMIIKTLKAMVAVTYPHTNYLCDEGDDPELKAICRELGVVHVTRSVKIDAKAGNINNALKQATGEICVVLDPDHVPIPQFLDRVLPYFEDEKIGFVQCVQAYGNQSESIIALGAAEQTYTFYGPMMMCMNTYGTVQAIGANCTFRRSALDSIGGHAAGLSEDMHTAMQIHAKGWKSIYVPEVLTRGLVPATLSSYYKQQLKWSRGTFELLFRTFPKLSKNFTWRQKIHYFTIPLYFLFGLVNLIDIAIPIAALCMAEVPWAVDLGRFAICFLPMCGFSLLIRMYAQRWLLEKHEHGLHLAGGLLRTATWWIFLIGFIYTVFKIQVPYIPTPKEDEHKNYWALSIPNAAVVLLCTLAMCYGLYIDWTPYSIAMAFYGFLNAGMLGFIVLMSQQKFIKDVQTTAQGVPGLLYVNHQVRLVTQKSKAFVYSGLRNSTVAVLAGVSLLFVSYNSISDEERHGAYKRKEIGGFYLGYSGADAQRVSGNYRENLNVSVIPASLEWNSTTDLSEGLNQAKQNKKLPFFKWSVAGFEQHQLYSDICNGKYDQYLTEMSSAFRSHRLPVFISFAPGFDKIPLTAKDPTPEKFILAWQYLYTFFNNLGISNLTWVWNPSSPNSLAYYPGPKFVDWLGVACLNYGAHQKDDDWFEFSELYTNYRKSYGSLEKPVMITEFGAQNGLHQDEWYKAALESISENFREIRSVIIFDGKQNFMIPTANDTLVYTADFSLTSNGEPLAAFRKEPFGKAPLIVSRQKELSSIDYHSPFVSGKPGDFKLLINGAPYYIRGVAYNTAHDWRDGNMPLTRKQVEKDFDCIKEMGANTIRRYDHGIYDHNVLIIAAEKGLNVQFGFWFDPEVDFYRDSIKVNEYFEQVEEKVRAYKDEPAVIAWSLGNETWGLLKHSYSKPYLTLVRNSYLQMIEELARRIHAIDPSRPVFSSIEHEEYQLPGELVAYHDVVPSVDVIGVNSYYKEQISTLNHVVWEFDSLRPYLISEFGPRGYWDPTYNRTKAGSLIEESESEKAAWYSDQWKNYVSAFKGFNVGGFAYCWHDRMEGSYTWFGLTDFKGRLKPSYYALKREWTGSSERNLPDFKIVQTGDAVGNIRFQALTKGLVPKNLRYEWYLLKDEFLDRVDNITVLDEGDLVEVDELTVPSDYRLYLYVIDEHDNVSTASFPIKIKG